MKDCVYIPYIFKYFRFKSWDDIYNFVKSEQNDVELLNLFKVFKESCRLLTGMESVNEILEDAAVLCLQLFLDEDIVMLKHLARLRQTFGYVTADTANKLCQVYNII